MHCVYAHWLNVNNIYCTGTVLKDNPSRHSIRHDDVSVVVPILNERQNLPVLLEQLEGFSFRQVILVDGGSTDNSWQWLHSLQKLGKKPFSVLEILRTDSSRAKQMNAGAKLATADVLLFLHADTQLPVNAITQIHHALASHDWGRFDVDFKEPDWRMNIIASCMNWRSRMTGIATGDQAIFVRRQIFENLQGYADIPLMEDVELSKRLLKLGKPACLQEKVKTSARRWLSAGVIRTVLLMWRLRWDYFIGKEPKELVKRYREER